MEEFSKVCKCCGEKKTIDNFKMTRWGKRAEVCTECATRKAHDRKAEKKRKREMEQAIEKAQKSERQKMLEQFTPRELMNRLAELGYRGNLTYTQTIDITNF